MPGSAWGVPRGFVGRADELALVPDSLLLSLLLPLSLTATQSKPSAFKSPQHIDVVWKWNRLNLLLHCIGYVVCESHNLLRYMAMQSHARRHAQDSECYQSSVDQAMSTRTMQLPVSQECSVQTRNLAQALTLCAYAECVCICVYVCRIICLGVLT